MEEIKEKKRLGVFYIRESTESQDKGFSPQKQENDIRAYAKKHNIELIGFYKDLVSGTSAEKRDSFNQMISDAMEGKFQVILVFHTSRFARNIEEAQHYKKLLRNKLGIEVLFVSQDFGDSSSPHVFLNETIHEVFDEHYSRQLSFWMRKAFSEKRRQGFCLGNPPLGYCKKKGNTKDLFIDEVEVKVVKEIFKLYASNKYSFSSLAKYLNDKGLKTKHKNPFTVSSIKDILKNKVYLGLVVSPRRDCPNVKGGHKAIINTEIFEKVQEIISEKSHTCGRPTAKHRFYLLQGLVYCFHCVKHMKGREEQKTNNFIPKMYCHTQIDRKNKEVYYYTCKFKREAKACNQPNVPCDIIDKQVLNYMGCVKVSEDIIRDTLKKASEIFDSFQDDSVEMQIVKNLLAKKRKLNFKYDNTDEISNDDYLLQLGEIEEELRKYKSIGVLMAGSFKANKERAMKKVDNFLRDFKTLWKADIGDDERRDWVRLIIKRVWVKDKKVVGIEPHDEFKIMLSSMKVLGHCPVATPKWKNELHGSFFYNQSFQ
ncbi:MAG: recombinase family protein [Patescibacteria group bacterium]|nr:recombinase family protein [Patescibacteria group bacterium]MDD4611051.1 recombinase family protein [Patescibacteria group bacterium]